MTVRIASGGDGRGAAGTPAAGGAVAPAGGADGTGDAGGTGGAAGTGGATDGIAEGAAQLVLAPVFGRDDG